MLRTFDKRTWGVSLEKRTDMDTIYVLISDVVIFMGCNVSCPNVLSQYVENRGLDDPGGKPDEVY